MDLISITIIYLFISMLFSAFMAITIFELRRYFGLSLTYAYLGLIYSMAILTASFLYHNIYGIYVTLGSVALFPTIIFIIMLVYISCGLEYAREGMYSVIYANIFYTLCLALMGYGMTVRGTVIFYNIRPELFMQGVRITLSGTLIFIIDVLLVVFIYTYLEKRLHESCDIFVHIFVTMFSVLMFDATAFPTLAFYGDPMYMNILSAHIIGKTFATAIFSIILRAYVGLRGPIGKGGEV